MLKDLNKKSLKILEAHNGLSAKMIEHSKLDGIWVSSLTHSLSKGLPDTELIPLSERVDLVREMRRVATKPIIVDCDTGGQAEHFEFHAKWFKDAGADALIIEDKTFPKKNSLLDVDHKLEDVDKFCERIKAGKKSGIMIIARLESLIAKKSIYDALIRAEAYVNAGVDGIMIHSKKEVSADEVMEFAKKFREKWDLPLVAVPTTYKLPEEHPFNIVIYANHLLRASYKAMIDTINGKRELASIDEILTII